MHSDRPVTSDGDDWRRRLDERLERLAAETPGLIAEIASLVASLPPDQLLFRAYFEYLIHSQGVRDDTDMGPEQIISVRMIDYVQSVIASVPPAADQKDELSDHDWETLRGAVERLFTTHIEAFATVRMRHEAGFQDPEGNLRESFLQSSLVRYWYSVSGKRFPYHFRQHLSDLLLPHSEMLEETLAITASDLVDAMVAIENALRFGPAVTQRDIEQSGLIERYADGTQDSNQIPGLGEAPEWLSRAVDELNWPTTEEDILDRAMGLGIFDVQRSTDLPEALLRKLSWEPGENHEFFAPGDLAGSPLRTWPIFERPFLRLDERYYCFAPLRLIDNICSALERLVIRVRPDSKDAWTEIRARHMERSVAKYFSRLLPDAQMFTNVHYSGHGFTGEVDLLILYDDHMLVVEAKSGEYTDLPPATDFEDHLRSVQRLGVTPSTQVERFLNYLEAAASVPIYDSNNKRARQKVADIRVSEFRQVSLCAVTLEPFTEFASQLHHLKALGINPGAQSTWLLSLDDLHVYADVFDNPLIFLHYVEHRTMASRANRLILDDELDHLGMYLAHNHYPAYADDQLLKDDIDTALWIGYRAPIERVFHERLLDPKIVLALRQEMPGRFSEVLDYLARSRVSGRAGVASCLLNRSGADRIRISESIAEELIRQPSAKKPRPLATYGLGEQIVLLCWSPHTGGRDPAVALRHAQVLVAMQKEETRLLLELTYSEEGELRDGDWRWVRYADIPEATLPELEASALRIRRARKAQTLAVRRQSRLADPTTTLRRIGRNEPCMCGSGKKYKRCCIDLEVPDVGSGRTGTGIS